MFIPKEGEWLTVHIPGQILRTKVHRVLRGGKTAMVEIATEPMPRDPNFPFGKIIPVQHKEVDGRERWEAVSAEQIHLEKLQRDLSPNKPKHTVSSGRKNATQGR